MMNALDYVDFPTLIALQIAIMQIVTACALLIFPVRLLRCIFGFILINKTASRIVRADITAAKDARIVRIKFALNATMLILTWTNTKSVETKL